MDAEVWKPTWHPWYEVSNLGRVRSWAPQGGAVKQGNPTYPKSPRMLRPGLGSHGYPSVVFGRGSTQLVHRLVAEAFIGPCPEGQECRHKDDDRTNARAENLEYGTRQDNVNDMMARRGHWRHYECA
jgi:hypothetical protein